ncbi:MAG TPA: acyl carrier protein [Nannocystaceae bacterium]|nr:acyl carrier protein [Nannocystaceae bacterium]
MSRDEIFGSVRSMMHETFELELDRITLESRLYEDLDLDSIDALDMVVKLQEIIHRRVDEHELRSLRTVGDVVEMVAAASASARV